MLRTIFVLFLTVLAIDNLYSNEFFTKNNEEIFIDNEEVNQYQGQLGLWVKVTDSKKLNYYLKKFGVNLPLVENINKSKISDLIGGYAFIPFSKEYCSELNKNDVTRTKVSSLFNGYIWPILGVERLTSVLGMRWGDFHPGLDIPAMNGTIIVSAMEGKVIRSKYVKGYGNLIEIEHRDGYVTRYGHCSVLLVKEGDFVKKGQIVALVGSTGRSTGNHLHFEIRCELIPLDPLDFLPKKDDLKYTHRLKNFKNYKIQK